MYFPASPWAVAAAIENRNGVRGRGGLGDDPVITDLPTQDYDTSSLLPSSGDAGVITSLPTTPANTSFLLPFTPGLATAVSAPAGTLSSLAAAIQQLGSNPGNTTVVPTGFTGTQQVGPSSSALEYIGIAVVGVIVLALVAGKRRR